jgi:hypothetical protein
MCQTGKAGIDKNVIRTCGGTRTPNQRFWRPLLYQLSYTRKNVKCKNRLQSYKPLFGLFVYRALVIARAEFFILNTSRLLTLVLRCRIIALFAFGAFECYDISHCCTFLKTISKLILSGRRDSNPRPTAWKAVTLPTELLPRFVNEL